MNNFEVLKLIKNKKSFDETRRSEPKRQRKIIYIPHIGCDNKLV